MARIVQLSHDIQEGMPHYPGLPGPRVVEHLSHRASRAHYEGRAEFSIARVEMVGNTGTYLDSPLHRFPGRADVASVPLERLVDLPAVVLDAATDGGRAVHVAMGEIRGRAVLVRTGWDQRWGSESYWEPGPYLSPELVSALVEGGAVLVGVDFWNVDDTTDPARPAHTRLLDGDVLIVEHLTGLAALDADVFTFSAVPLPVVTAGSMPVRAWATVPG